MKVKDRVTVLRRRFSLASTGAVGLAATAAPAPSAVATDPTVHFEGLRSTAGRLAATVCDDEAFLTSDCAMSGTATAVEGMVVVRDVPPGVYAVQALHDENANGRIDMAMFDWPREGIGFSRDAPMRFGPPAFADAAVRLERSDARMTITIQYF